jgi:hypothetical protein
LSSKSTFNDVTYLKHLAELKVTVHVFLSFFANGWKCRSCIFWSSTSFGCIRCTYLLSSCRMPGSCLWLVFRNERTSWLQSLLLVGRCNSVGNGTLSWFAIGFFEISRSPLCLNMNSWSLPFFRDWMGSLLRFLTLHALI